MRVKPAKAKRRQESSSDAAKRLKPDPSAPPQPAVKTEPETGKSHIPQIKEEPQQEEEEDGLAGLLGEAQENLILCIMCLFTLAKPLQGHLPLSKTHPHLSAYALHIQ